MMRPSIDLESLERRAADEGSLGLAMAAQSIRDAALESCVACGIFAGAATGFALAPDQCRRLLIGAPDALSAWHAFIRWYREQAEMGPHFEIRGRTA